MSRRDEYDGPVKLVVTNKPRKTQHVEEQTDEIRAVRRSWQSVQVPCPGGGFRTEQVPHEEPIYRKRGRTIERHGLQFGDKWYAAGDEIPAELMSRNKRAALVGCGYLEEVKLPKGKK